MCYVNKLHRTAIHSLSFKHINTSKYVHICIQQNQYFSSTTFDYNYNFNYKILQLQLRKLQLQLLLLQIIQTITTIKPTMTTASKQTIQVQLHADHR